MQFQRGVPLNRAASVQKEAEVKDPKEKDVDPEVVPFESDEILQCTDPTETLVWKRRKDVDKHRYEVLNSTKDLAIDG